MFTTPTNAVSQATDAVDTTQPLRELSLLELSLVSGGLPNKGWDIGPIVAPDTAAQGLTPAAAGQ